MDVGLEYHHNLVLTGLLCKLLTSQHWQGHACTLGYVLPWEQILGRVLFVLDLHAEMGYFVAR